MISYELHSHDGAGWKIEGRYDASLRHEAIDAARRLAERGTFERVRVVKETYDPDSGSNQQHTVFKEKSSKTQLAQRAAARSRRAASAQEQAFEEREREADREARRNSERVASNRASGKLIFALIAAVVTALVIMLAMGQNGVGSGTVILVGGVALVLLFLVFTFLLFGGASQLLMIVSADLDDTYSPRGDRSDLGPHAERRSFWLFDLAGFGRPSADQADANLVSDLSRPNAPTAIETLDGDVAAAGEEAAAKATANADEDADLPLTADAIDAVLVEDLPQVAKAGECLRRALRHTLEQLSGPQGLTKDKIQLCRMFIAGATNRFAHEYGWSDTQARAYIAHICSGLPGDEQLVRRFAREFEDGFIQPGGARLYDAGHAEAEAFLTGALPAQAASADQARPGQAGSGQAGSGQAGSGQVGTARTETGQADADTTPTDPPNQALTGAISAEEAAPKVLLLSRITGLDAPPLAATAELKAGSPEHIRAAGINRIRADHHARIDRQLAGNGGVVLKHFDFGSMWGHASPTIAFDSAVALIESARQARHYQEEDAMPIQIAIALPGEIQGLAGLQAIADFAGADQIVLTRGARELLATTHARFVDAGTPSLPAMGGPTQLWYAVVEDELSLFD